MILRLSVEWLLRGSNVRFNYYCTAGNLNRCMGIFGDLSSCLWIIWNEKPWICKSCVDAHYIESLVGLIAVAHQERFFAGLVSFRALCLELADVLIECWVQTGFSSPKVLAGILADGTLNALSSDCGWLCRSLRPGKLLQLIQPWRG